MELLRLGSFLSAHRRLRPSLVEPQGMLRRPNQRAGGGRPLPPEGGFWLRRVEAGTNSWARKRRFSL